MKFNSKGYKIHTVPNGGQAILDSDNKLVAYKLKDDGDLKNWDFVRSDYRN